MRRSSGDLYRDSYTGRPSRGAAMRTAAKVLLGLGAVLSLFLVGDYLQRLSAYRSARETGREYDPKLGPVSLLEPLRSIALNSLGLLPRPWADARLLESGLPVYDLRIASDDLKELQQTAERVTAQSISTGIPRRYLPAQMLIDDRWEPIKVKLRGLYSQHYIKTRPSLRLKFPDRKLFRGAKQINLLDPYDKGLTVDVTTSWELRQHDLLTWDARFVVLRLNDDVIGVFQEIEQFGRSMSDRNLRPEGLIFSGYGQVFGSKGGGIYDKAALPIARIQSCLQVDDDRFVEESVAISSQQNLPCDWDFLQTYFQLDRWAWAASLALLMHSSHAWHPDNVRMFWDPARGQFEPIPWDYSQLRIDPERFPEGEAHQFGYARIFLASPEFRRMRDRRAWTLLTQRVDAMVEYSEGLFDSLREALQLDLRHPDFSLDEERQAHHIETLYWNRDDLVARFSAHGLRGRVHPVSGQQGAVSLENRGKAFVEVRGLTLRGAAGSRNVALGEPVVVDGFWQGLPGAALLRFGSEAGEQLVGLEVYNGVTGERLLAADLQLQPTSDPSPLSVAAAAPAGFELDNVHAQAGLLRFGPGLVHLTGQVEVPRTVEVVFEPGLDLRMAPDAALMIYGDLTGLGSESAPILVSGSESDREWGGIFVQGTRRQKSRVRLHHTRIVGGRGGENERTFFTSSFAVHDGVVELSECEFVDSRADDGMNLKYSEVMLTGNLIRGSRDDALDCDFCTGELRGNTIRHSGGDGLDFSGSDVLVSQNLVEHCADKGMSIGERTLARLIDNEVRDCYTGVAVKDLSEVEIRDLRLRRLQVGVAAYIKKPTFGPSRARLFGVDMVDVVTQTLRDDACTIEWEPLPAAKASLPAPIQSPDPASKASSPASSRISTPSSWAFRSLLPGSAPPTT